MGVNLTEQELDDFLGSGHTLILSTLRKSGEPFTTPNWYLWMDGAFWMRTGAKSAKVQHIRRDPRVCCLVEDGEAWVDLRAVIANCQAEFVEDEALTARFNAGFNAKYAPFRRDNAVVPEATKRHYSGDRVLIRMTPRPGEVRSWYNRKIRMKQPA
jgi:nitroimidazol reductase NimA-like FMN-containing flavoprotein (pyridoxamine 5'-phosphate oxidase superfamily)